MLKDIFFYPLALLIAAVMIATALSLGDYETFTVEEIRAQGFTVEGQDLTRLTASPATNYDYFPATPNNPAFARMYTSLTRDVAPPSPGVFATLSPDYEEAFAGQKLRLTLTARAAPQSGMTKFDFAYFTLASGSTGWTRQALNADWSEYVLEFKSRPLSGEADLNYFSVWPGLTAEPLKMDVSYMRVEVISAP